MMDYKIVKKTLKPFDQVLREGNFRLSKFSDSEWTNGNDFHIVADMMHLFGNTYYFRLWKEHEDPNKAVYELVDGDEEDWDFLGMMFESEEFFKVEDFEI